MYGWMRLKMTDECLECDVMVVVEEDHDYYYGVDIRVVQAAVKTVKASEMDVALREWMTPHDREACEEHLLEVEPCDYYLSLEEVAQNDLPWAEVLVPNDDYFCWIENVEVTAMKVVREVAYMRLAVRHLNEELGLLVEVVRDVNNGDAVRGEKTKDGIPVPQADGKSSLGDVIEWYYVEADDAIVPKQSHSNCEEGEELLHNLDASPIAAAHVGYAESRSTLVEAVAVPEMDGEDIHHSLEIPPNNILCQLVGISFDTKSYCFRFSCSYQR